MTPQQLAEFINTLEQAKGEANIDGYGDEGAGYDFNVMADYVLRYYDVTPKD